VQGVDEGPVERRAGLQGLDGLGDLHEPRHEDEDRAVVKVQVDVLAEAGHELVVEDGLVHDLKRLLRVLAALGVALLDGLQVDVRLFLGAVVPSLHHVAGELHDVLEPVLGNGEGAAGDLHHRHPAEVVTEGVGVERRGHQHELERLAPQQQVLQDDEYEVRVEVALVHLVYEHVRDGGQVRVALQPAEQDAGLSERAQKKSQQGGARAGGGGGERSEAGTKGEYGWCRR
jgi:hypothetical protein